MKKVVFLGLGYIGLPTAAVAAAHGFEVIGVDVNPSVVETINQGKIHIVEPELGDDLCMESAWRWKSSLCGAEDLSPTGNQSVNSLTRISK